MITQENTTLVLIDVQGNLAEAMYGKEALFDNLERLIKGVQVLNLPIILTEQVPEKLGRTVPRLAELLNDIVPIEKNTFSCCGDESFISEIKKNGRGQLLIAGIEAHVCVYQTVRDLLNLGYEVHVVVDAISSRRLENKELATGKMMKRGAEITSVEMALFELLEKAEGEEFRQIIKIVK